MSLLESQSILREMLAYLTQVRQQETLVLRFFLDVGEVGG